MSDEEEAPAPPLPCCLCGICEDDQLRFGQLFKLDDIAVHHFCLLFSDHLAQNGKDDEGAEGFLSKDIKALKTRVAATICCHCEKGGATTQCTSIKCSKKYHIGCAVKANALLQFFGKFKSFCEEHRPRQNVIGGETGEPCSICLDATDPADQLHVLWTPCCKHFFHRSCLQRMAYHFGYFFYCPGCRNKDTTSGFLKHMKHFGIFIPKRDASWEMVPNAFGELLERHLMCDVRYCLCVMGRQHQASDVESPWRLCVCETCGSQGTHLACSSLPPTTARWVCPACSLQPAPAVTGKCSLRAFFQRRPAAAGEASSSGVSTLSGSLSLRELLSELEEPEQLVRFTISPISGLAVVTRRLCSERVPMREPGGRPVQYHPLELLPETTVTREDQRQAQMRLWSENHVTAWSDEEEGRSSYDPEKRKLAAPASSRRPAFGQAAGRTKKPAKAASRGASSTERGRRPGPASARRSGRLDGPSRGRARAASAGQGPAVDAPPPAAAKKVTPPRAKGKWPASVVDVDSQPEESDDSSVIVEADGRGSKPGAKPARGGKHQRAPKTKPDSNAGKPVHATSVLPGRSARKVTSYVEIVDSDDPDDPDDQSDIEDVTPQKVRAAYTSPDKSVQPPGRRLVMSHNTATTPSGLFPSNPLPSNTSSAAGGATSSLESLPDPQLKLINRARAALHNFPCPVCDKTHQTLTQATLHYYTHDVGESLFRCKICSATFSYWQPAHVRNEHPQIKPEEVFNQMENRFEQGKRNVAEMILDKKGIAVGNMLDHVLDASSNLLKVHLPVPQQHKEVEAPVVEAVPPKPMTLQQLREEYKRKQREKEEKESQQKKTLEELRRQHQQKQGGGGQQQKPQENSQPKEKTGVKSDVKFEKASVKLSAAPKTQAQALLSGLASARVQDQAKKDKLAALKSARIAKVGSSIVEITHVSPSSSSAAEAVAVVPAAAEAPAVIGPAAGSPRTTADQVRRLYSVLCDDCNFRGITGAVKRHRIWHSLEAESRRRGLKYRCRRCFYASNMAAHVQVHLVCVHFMDSTAGGGICAPGGVEPSPMSESAWKMARAVGDKIPEDGDRPTIGLRRFDCAFCDCFFMTQVEYYAHYEDWHMKDKSRPVARACPYDNCYTSDVNGHAKWYHKAAPVRNRVCPRCGGTIYEGKESEHRMTSCRPVSTLVKKLMFECPMPICGFGSTKQVDVSHHLAQCHSLWIRGLSGSRIAPYICPKCCEFFMYKDLKAHVLECEKVPPMIDAEPKLLTKLVDLKASMPNQKRDIPTIKQETVHPSKKPAAETSSPAKQQASEGPQKRASSAQPTPVPSPPSRLSESCDVDDPGPDDAGDGGVGHSDSDDDVCALPDPVAKQRKRAFVAEVKVEKPESPAKAERPAALAEAEKPAASEKVEKAAALEKVRKSGAPEKIEKTAAPAEAEEPEAQVEDENLQTEPDDAEQPVDGYREVTVGGFMGMAEYAPFIEGEDGQRDVDGQLVCGLCPARFAAARLVHRHRNYYHYQELRAMNMFVVSCGRPTGYMCPICGWVVSKTQKWTFVMHVVRHKISVPLSCVADEGAVQAEPAPAPAKPGRKYRAAVRRGDGKDADQFRCVTCSAKFSSKAGLELHVRQHIQKRPREPQSGAEVAGRRKLKR